MFGQISKSTKKAARFPIVYKFFVSMKLMDKGSKCETNKIELNIEKPGISSFIFKFAHKFSFIWFVSAIIAIGLGISAGLIFKEVNIFYEQRAYFSCNLR